MNQKQIDEGSQSIFHWSLVCPCSSRKVEPIVTVVCMFVSFGHPL